MKYPILIKQNTADGYIGMVGGGLCDLSYPSSTTRRGRVQGGGELSPTIMAGNSFICRITLYEIPDCD